MYIGKFTAVIEADIHIDDSNPHILPFEKIRENLTGSGVCDEIHRILLDDVFEPMFTDLKVTPKTAWLINDKKQEDVTNG